jgi:hypothetical protein
VSFLKLGRRSLRAVTVTVSLLALLGSASCVGLGGKSDWPGSPSAQNSASTISVSPSPASFGSVVVGGANSQTMTISNAGTATVTIGSAAVSGAGFSVSGLTTPLTLGGGGSANFTVSFQPSAAGPASGTIALEASGSSSAVAVNLAGTGMAASLTLASSTSSLSFGSVNVGSSSSQAVTLTNAGNTNIAFGSVSASGSGFAASGGSNVTLAPNQSVTVTVTFDPLVVGAASGGLSISSNASDSVVVALSGTGVSQPVQHSVALNWNASTSTVSGYFVYRGTVTGGPYSQLNSSVDPSTSYTDSTVQGGQTYYYVVSSVNSSNVQSPYSNEVSVTVPSP